MKATDKKNAARGNALEELSEVEKRQLAAELGLMPDVEGDELTRVLDEVSGSGGGVVRVHRVRENGKQPEFVDEFDVAAFSLKLLRDVAGGGEYLIRVLNSARQYQKQARVSIAASVKPVTLSPAPAAESAALDKITAALEKQMQLLTMLMMRQGQQPDANAQRRAMLEEFQLISNIVGGKGGGNDLSSTLDAAKSLMEFANINGGGDGSPWPSVVATVADKLAEPLMLLASSMSRRKAAPGAAPAQPQRPAVPGQPRPAALPPAKPTQPLTEEEVTTDEDDEAEELLDAIDFLVNKAEKGGDPKFFAQLVLSEVDHDTLRTFLSQGVDPMVAELAKLDERVNQHLGFFQNLGQVVATELNVDAATPASTAAGKGAPGVNS